MGTETRAQRRPIFVHVQVRNEDAISVRKARNLSIGGMFIDAPVPLPPGTVVHLQFGLPEGPRIDCEGEVRWNTAVMADGKPVRYPGMGVAFHGLDDEQRRAIEAYVSAGL